MALALEMAVALAQDAQLLKTQSDNAKKFASAHGGATLRTTEAVREWITDSTVR
jgi:hypothetical protein